MKQRFAALILASVAFAVAACGSKKPTATPKPVEPRSGATGGAAYGGARYGHSSGPAARPANPCAPAAGSGS